MKEILFYWSDLNSSKKNFIDTNSISFRENKNTVTVDWKKYHVTYSKKWLLDDLLSDIKFKVIDDIDKCKNKEIILVMNNLTEKLSFYKYENICLNNKVFLIHLGDEFFHNLELSLNIYKRSYYIFRQYYFLSDFKNLMHIPLGYKSSNNFYKSSVKDFFWSFCGTIYKSSRHDMIDVFTKNFKNYFLHKTDHFADQKSLTADKMFEIISKSQFTLCPQGFYHPETYRVFETLENNSVPIIEDSYSIYNKILPNHSFITIRYWSEFLKIYKNLNYDDVLSSNLNWYSNFKKNLN